MLLLKKKLNSLAIALIALSPLVAAADPAAPTPDVSTNKPAAPAVVPVAPPARIGIYQSIKADDISKYISGFRVQKYTDETGTRLRFIGQGDPNCLRHVRIELDTPNDDQTGHYGLRIERTDLMGTDNKAMRAEDDCTLAITRNCSRDTCVSINSEEQYTKLGLAGIENKPLIQDGKIQLRIDDRTLPEGHPDAIAYKDIPKVHGGPVEFKTPETIAAEYEAQQKKETNELIVSTCKEAQKGSRDDLEYLKEIVGAQKLEENSKFFEKIEEKCDEAELNAKKKEAEALPLSQGIDLLCNYGKENTKMKKQIAAAVVELAKKNVDEMDLDESNDKAVNAKFIAGQNALKCAWKLDPKNLSYKKGYYQAKLARYKFDAGTGSDSFWNDTTRRQSYSDFAAVSRWASRSRDPEVTGLLKDYNKTFADRWVPMAAMTPQGPVTMGYVPGSSLDETFVKRSLEEEFRDYRSSMMSNVGSSIGVGSYNMSPSYGGMSPGGYSGGGGYGPSRY